MRFMKIKKDIGAGMLAANGKLSGMIGTAVKTSPAAAMAAMMCSRAYALTGTGGGGDNAATEAINGVLNVLFLITNVIGIMFVLIGFVRLVIAHSQEDAPGQQKAAMFIGTGIALILLRLVMGSMNPTSWVNIPNG